MPSVGRRTIDNSLSVANLICCFRRRQHWIENLYFVFCFEKFKRRVFKFNNTREANVVFVARARWRRFRRKFIGPQKLAWFAFITCFFYSKCVSSAKRFHSVRRWCSFSRVPNPLSFNLFFFIFLNRLHNSDVETRWYFGRRTKSRRDRSALRRPNGAELVCCLVRE